MPDIYYTYRDKRGVTTVGGTWDGNALWFPIVITSAATMCAILSVAALETWVQWKNNDYLKGFLLGIVMTSIWGTWAVRLFLLRRRLRTLSSAWWMQRRLAMTPQEFENFVTENHILPRYNMSGNDLYSDEDFMDKTTLLRRSSKDQTPAEELLRVPQQGDNNDENLLRAAIRNNDTPQ